MLSKPSQSTLLEGTWNDEAVNTVRTPLDVWKQARFEYLYDEAIARKRLQKRCIHRALKKLKRELDYQNRVETNFDLDAEDDIRVQIEKLERQLKTFNSEVNPERIHQRVESECGCQYARKLKINSHPTGQSAMSQSAKSPNRSLLIFSCFVLIICALISIL